MPLLRIKGGPNAKKNRLNYLIKEHNRSDRIIPLLEDLKQVYVAISDLYRAIIESEGKLSI